MRHLQEVGSVTSTSSFCLYDSGRLCAKITLTLILSVNIDIELAAVVRCTLCTPAWRGPGAGQEVNRPLKYFSWFDLM